MSQVIVLDPHIWIWFINQEFNLFPAHWREASVATWTKPAREGYSSNR